ncbi:hypothetical protein [Nocardioides sp. InS609-2]|uniref:hypothetical protein n=1 Tax=Nocardioides sp. InS609-2 TaxID=2760705 RepID=UPI0020C07C23|nr:hypothetical protein [Nocardioides sp. InS609-2]
MRQGLSDDGTTYRIEYQIQRQGPGDDDFVEIGFGSSGESRDLEGAVFAIESYVSNGQWETEPGQPDPDEVRAAIQRGREERG